MKLTETQMHALIAFDETLFISPYATFPEGKLRDVLRRAGYIERWNPILKVTGRRKPWRITDAGLRALSEAERGK